MTIEIMRRLTRTMRILRIRGRSEDTVVIFITAKIIATAAKNLSELTITELLREVSYQPFI